MNVLKLSFVSLAVISFASTAFAELNKLTIRDCNKEVKLAEEISTSSVKVLAELEGKDVTKLSAITLTNNKTEAKTSKTVANNKVILDEITAGDWTLCSEPEQVTFKSVSILKNAGIGSAGLAGASLASVGAVAVLLNNSGDSNNSNRVVGTNTQATEQVTDENVNEVVSDAVDAVADNKHDKCNKNRTAGARASSPCFIGDDDDVTPISPLS